MPRVNKQTAKKRGKAGPGRPKGSVNKTTASVKQALIDAFEKKGGVPSLLAWADEHPGDFYKLWGRLAPTEVTGDINAALTIRVVRE